MARIWRQFPPGGILVRGNVRLVFEIKVEQHFLLESSPFLMVPSAAFFSLLFIAVNPVSVAYTPFLNVISRRLHIVPDERVAARSKTRGSNFQL
jgi:hypothetical protein